MNIFLAFFIKRENSYLSDEDLTENEMRFLKLNCSEMNYKEICSEKHLSPSHVKIYIVCKISKLVFSNPSHGVTVIRGTGPTCITNNRNRRP
jgi:hypothetical protein